MVGISVLIFYYTTNWAVDKSKYGPDANKFRPERWLDKENPFEVPQPYHFSYGAGARMCTAVNLSNRILYAIFFRSILSFKITESSSAPPPTHYVDYNRDTTAASAIPKDFKLKFIARNPDVLDECIRRSQEATIEFDN
jgi:phenylacetate 2-hydroxylase